jgi:predicted transcriptional regulator
MKVLKMMPILVSIYALQANAKALVVGQVAPTVTLEGDLGGRVSGESWSSDEIAKSGLVTSVFYVDPEEKAANEPVEEAYDKEKFPFERHASIAIINMAAAWYPNSMINNMLKKKQDKFPKTTYVKDMKKTLVKEWDLKDDAVNLIVFDKQGKVLFAKRGKMSPDEITDLMKLIRANL